MVNGNVRLKIVKMWANEIDYSFIISFDKILNNSARQLAHIGGINYEALSTTDRLLMTRFRCPLCGVLPLYFLDMKYLNKIRCGKCSIIVGLKNNSGKYGKIRKKIAIIAGAALVLAGFLGPGNMGNGSWMEADAQLSADVVGVNKAYAQFTATNIANAADRGEHSSFVLSDYEQSCLQVRNCPKT